LGDDIEVAARASDNVLSFAFAAAGESADVAMMRLLALSKAVADKRG
jgi:hypothetical protein